MKSKGLKQMKWSEFTKAVSSKSVSSLKMNLALFISKLSDASDKEKAILKRQIHCVCLELKDRRKPEQTEFLESMYSVYPIEPLPKDFFVF